MKTTTLVKVAILGAVLVGCGVGAYATVERLSDQTLSTLVGAIAVLVVVVVVAVLFIAKDAIYARILRRQLAQDNFDDMKQIAMIFKLMGGRAPNVNVKIPEGQQQWPPVLIPSQPPAQQQQPWQFDGAYRDTTVDSEIEIE